MPVVDESLIEEAGRRLARAAPGARVILFGSHARGEADPRSDVDFLVIEPDVDDEAASRSGCAERSETFACRPTSSSSAAATSKSGRTCAAASSTPLFPRAGSWPADGRPEKPRRAAPRPCARRSQRRQGVERGRGRIGLQSGFNAQQAVEKALKAVLAGRGEDFPFTHDIALLIELCEDHGLRLPDDLLEADRLTPYAAALRYGMGDPAAVASDKAIRWAALAIEWAGSQLQPDDG